MITTSAQTQAGTSVYAPTFTRSWHASLTQDGCARQFCGVAQRHKRRYERTCQLILLVLDLLDGLLYVKLAFDLGLWQPSPLLVNLLAQLSNSAPP